MFCFGLQSIARFINTNVSYFKSWRVKENSPETFKSQLQKKEIVIHRPGSVRIVRNCALGPSRRSQPTASRRYLGYTQTRDLKNHLMQTTPCKY